jgi:hypothetical protein
VGLKSSWGHFYLYYGFSQPFPGKYSPFLTEADYAEGPGALSHACGEEYYYIRQKSQASIEYYFRGFG